MPEGACEGATGVIGPGSCIGFESCVNSTGDIDSGSCQGERVRYSLIWLMFRPSYYDTHTNYRFASFTQACEGNTGKIGSNSCKGEAACYLNDAGK